MNIKKRIKENLNLTGSFIKEYALIYELVLLLVSGFEIFFIINWCIKATNYSFKNMMYLSAYILLLSSSLICFILLLISKKIKISPMILSIILHVYSFLFEVWALIITLLDLYIGNTIIVELTISMVLGGLLIISPIFYTTITVIAFIIIFIFNAKYNYNYFQYSGIYMNLIIFVIMTIIMSFRHHSVRIKEAKQREYLKKLSYTDSLTGLGSETAYYKEVDEINKKIEVSDISFGVCVMDLNNVKATNDVYGHRYGCHLIVTGGLELPKIFNTSKLFHIGGDEFVAIVYGSDLDNIEKITKDFEQDLDYKEIEYEGHKLILSVSMGFSRYEKGLKYKDVFQKADMNMYLVKKNMKEKYHLER